MTVVHRDLAESELHEPKGASVASDKQIYVADGAGSGSFQPGPKGVSGVARPAKGVLPGEGVAEIRGAPVEQRT